MVEHILHVSRGSAPCRATLWTLEILQQIPSGPSLDIEVRDVDMSLEEHVTEGFLTLDPTLQRNGEGLRESRAIMRYLCELAVVQSLYPEDPWARAQVDALLGWDVSVFYPAIAGFVYPQVFHDALPEPDAVEDLHDVLHVLDRQFADGRPRLMGERLTLADLSITCGLSLLELVLDDGPAQGVDALSAYYERMTSMESWRAINGPFVAWKLRTRKS